MNMVTKNEFSRAFVAIAMNFSKDYKPEQVGVIYQFFIEKHSINPEQFGRVFKKLMAMDADQFFSTFHGGMPSVGDWLKLCELQQPTEDDKLTIAKKAFLEKVSDTLSCDFPSERYLPRFDREYFDKHLDDTEKRAMRTVGNISTLWSQVHNGEYSSNSRTILKELGMAFEDIWNVENIPSFANYAEERKQLSAPTLQLEKRD